MKKIVVINGHPDKDSYNSAIAVSYREAAKAFGADLRYIAIGELYFNPNLQFGYRQRMELEPDLVTALEDLHWSDHQVWIHPIWWLGMPAVMKGFLDRAFLPGITFKRNKDGTSEGLFKAKTARIITTAGDISTDDYDEVYKSSGLVQLQKGILEYCGISSFSNDYIGPLHEMNDDDRKKWIERIKIVAVEDSKKKSFVE
ncbi:NAD(P)H-dependent oxidoreductase [Chryseobacterium sp. Mn2064]|uniref:NAD(P)H-dependent oxidoreductase n=1 Tax=Chryseobacterium sp. Mn2064 TaxID=3395263 RepID=UPI003BBDBE1C